MTQDEFYENINEWISQDKSRWNHITLLAFFCHKYEQKNKARFRLVKWKSDPGKGKESRDFAKLFSLFSPEGYSDLDSKEKKGVRFDINQKIYNYINWIFDYKFRSGDKSVTGTGIFLLPAMVNEFERMYSDQLSRLKLKRSMKELVGWCEENAPEIFDLHELEDVSDLKLICKYMNMYRLGQDSCEAVVVFKAKEVGLI